MGCRFLVFLALVACERPDAPRPVSSAGAAPALAIAGAYLRWDVHQVDARIALRTVSWIDASDRVVWQRELPGRLGAMSLCCWNGATEAYLADARHSTYFAAEAPIIDGDTLLLQDEEELLVLAIADGHTVFAWADDPGKRFTYDDYMIIDYGRVTITVDGRTCESAVPHGHFARSCGGELVYFDKGLLAVFSRSPYAVVEQRRVPGTGQHCNRPEQAVDRAETIGNATVRFRGVRLTMCTD